MIRTKRAETGKKTKESESRAKRLRKYRKDPVGYAEEELGLTLTSDQKKILRSIVQNRRTAVQASHAIGKTFIAAVAANFWFDCWDKHIVYITAPTWKSALGLTFTQVVKRRRLSSLPGRILESGLIHDNDEIKKSEHFIRALNTDTGEGFQGEHSAPILIILEEAVGVPHYIHEAAGGLMTHPDCAILEIGNPTDEATDFGEHCSSPAYNVLSISVFDHPNIDAELHCQPPPFPDAVRLLWLYEMLRDECDIVDTLSLGIDGHENLAAGGDLFEYWALEDIERALQGIPVPPDARKVVYEPNAVFQGRALGLFPTQAQQQVVPRAWLRDLHIPKHSESGLPEIGCDVAAMGNDRSAAVCRRGPVALELREERKMDTVAVANMCQEMADTAALPRPAVGWMGCNPKKIPIRIDITGGLGRGPYDTLKERGYNAVGINSSNQPQDTEQFDNVRSELWFWCRERARQGEMDLSRLPKDKRERLIRELSTPKYKIRKGKKVVDPKDEIRKLLDASPDLADAWNLSLYNARDPLESTMEALQNRLKAMAEKKTDPDLPRAEPVKLDPVVMQVGNEAAETGKMVPPPRMVPPARRKTSPSG